jgi:hypothetical protein
LLPFLGSKKESLILSGLRVPIEIEAEAFVDSSTMVISQAEAMPPSMT